MDLDRSELEDQEVLFVVISSHDDPKSKSNTIGLERISEDRALRIQQDLEEIGQEVSIDTPLGQLIVAGYFEDQELLIDALYHYRRAHQLSPEVDDYELIFEDFLTRNQLR